MRAAVLIAIALIWAGGLAFLIFREEGFMLMLPGASFLPDLIRQPATVVILTTFVIGWIVPLLWGLSEAISRRH